MTASTSSMLEGLRDGITAANIQAARDRTWQAVSAMAQQIKPGMSEKDAVRMANQTLAGMGCRKFWHKCVIRFGKNTLLGFKEESDPDVRLADDDIFFIDIGPIWDGIEGDAGDTFIVGAHPEHARCLAATREIFRATAEKWRTDGLTGAGLYQFAAGYADELGWQLHPEYVRGHRISEFPHSFYRGGRLEAFDRTPTEKRWVLEIQIRHPALPFGGFKEDVL